MRSLSPTNTGEREVGRGGGSDERDVGADRWRPGAIRQTNDGFIKTRWRRVMNAAATPAPGRVRNEIQIGKKKKKENVTVKRR